MSRSRTFGTSVPNTYAQGVASLSIGWGGIRGDLYAGVQYAHGTHATCECGRVKPKRAEGCFRCLSIDQLRKNTEGMILAALESGDAMSLAELAAHTDRDPRVLLRYLPSLIEEGRVRWWWEPADEVQRLMKAYGRSAEEPRLRLFSGGVKKMYRRTW